MRTPWGMSDGASQIFKEIYHYGTPGHGGIAVPKEYHKYLTEHSIFTRAENPEGVGKGILWFEEDCAYALPLLEIKASLGELSDEELKEKLKSAIYYFKGFTFTSEHPLHDMIRRLEDTPEIQEALRKSKENT